MALVELFLHLQRRTKDRTRRKALVKPDRGACEAIHWTWRVQLSVASRE